MNRKLNPLTENHLFAKAYRSGVCDVSKLAAVYILKNIRRTPDGGLYPTSMGIAVNAKLGGAVQRNRVKRIIREGYRACLENLKPGLIIVISARGAAFAKSAGSAAMARAIGASLRNLGAYNDQSLVKKQPKSESGSKSGKDGSRAFTKNSKNEKNEKNAKNARREKKN